MKIVPLYFFEDGNETGIDKVPTDAVIYVKDSDGEGNPLMIMKTSNVDLTSETTIGDFINNENVTGTLVPKLEVLDGGTY
jgi:hypothetical protein